MSQRLSFFVAVAVSALLSCPASFGAEASSATVGRAIAEFRLPDAAGKNVALADFRDKKALVVIFLGTQCPINNAYLPRLGELHKEFAAKGVGFLAINANHQDT